MKISIKMEKVSSDVLNYLQKKYAQVFTIEKTVQMIDMEKGMYSLIICKDEKYNEKFNVYYYHDFSTVYIEDEKFDYYERLSKYDETKIFDCYGTIVLSHQYANLINEQIGDNLYVLCNMVLFDYFPSQCELNMNLKNSVNDLQDHAYPRIYVFYEQERATFKLIQTVKRFICQFNFAIQYVYICAVDKLEKEQILMNYNENKDNYSDYILESNSKVLRIDKFYLTSTGLVRKQDSITKKE